MITKLSEKLADFFVVYDEKECEEKEIYVYGCEIIISTICNFIIVLLCGVVFKSMIHSFIFFLILASLRTYSGGYHAKTYLGCKF